MEAAYISIMLFTFESHVDEFKRKIEDGIERAMDEIGKSVMESAKEKCPVDTGNLRDSITYVAYKDSVTVGTDVEYSVYVELGTYKMAAQPYLRPALEECGRDALEALERSM